MGVQEGGEQFFSPQILVNPKGGHFLPKWIAPWQEKGKHVKCKPPCSVIFCGYHYFVLYFQFDNPVYEAHDGELYYQRLESNGGQNGRQNGTMSVLPSHTCTVFREPLESETKVQCSHLSHTCTEYRESLQSETM